MPKPQYNVKQTDTGSKNYYKPAIQPAGVYNWSSMPQIHYSPMPNLPVPTPKVNPLKNWWNSIVNNARQNAYAPVNIWDTVAPNPPKFNTSTEQASYAGLWDTVKWTPPTPRPLPQPGYSIFDPFGVNENMWSGVKTTRTSTAPKTFQSPITKPSQNPNTYNAVKQYADTDDRNRILSWDEIAQLPDYGRPPQEEDAYQEGVWVANPEMPAGGGYGGGYGGYGGSSYYSMPNSPRYKGYGGGYGSGGSPRSARYQGNYGGYGGGYGGYAGGQSQRSAWYGALLQWNI